MFSFGHCPNYLSPPSPQFGQLVPLFLDVKNDVLARITEPSKDDYDNDVSDNCDNNYGTFDDFGVKNDQKVPLFDPHYPERARLSFSPEKRPFSYPVVRDKMVFSDDA